MAQPQWGFVDIALWLQPRAGLMAQKRDAHPLAKVMYVELQKRRNPTPPKADRAVGHYIFCNSSYATLANFWLTWAAFLLKLGRLQDASVVEQIQTDRTATALGATTIHGKTCIGRRPGFPGQR